MKTFRKYYTKIYYIGIAFATMIIMGCSKDDCSDEFSTFNLDVSQIKTTSFVVSLSVILPKCEMGRSATAGVKISTSSITSIQSEGTDYGEGGKTGFNTIVEGLIPNTKYYLRPSIIISLSRIELGPQVEVTTLP
ncbi:MAG TPA: hypothetical protein VKN36_13325 [Eudoraea sp.]|nr:hypothetical protein [Eudoraea sp.]